MISGHGNGRWTAMEGVFIMVGKCGGDQNLGLIPSCISIVPM
jgi:hypothetical protein